ncbi:hypothetical protein ACFQ3L_01955 [Lacticaseibacillus jixianensis]|uniref:Uncharacterized protein n=1 Tax=Lacticaseibacillus jixianensis TaxID=2486012 RepID=A0ABW4B6A6_9LACO|nr:hypothetical protein [Lacticaseibacillus jixianensis]
MIFVNSALYLDKMVAVLEAYDEDGVSFKLNDKKGMRATFTTTATDLDAAAKTAKAEIKKQSWASAILFQVGVA